MSFIWFRKVGWVHRPVSPVGWTIVVLTAALILQVFRAVDRHSHSVSDTLWGVFLYAALFLIIADWVAAHTSGEKTASSQESHPLQAGPPHH